MLEVLPSWRRERKQAAPSPQGGGFFSSGCAKILGVLFIPGGAEAGEERHDPGSVHSTVLLQPVAHIIESLEASSRFLWSEFIEFN